MRLNGREWLARQMNRAGMAYVAEAGCKTVIGGRCKQSGMFWSESGAENSLTRRCLQSSRRLEDFWKHRLNERAARNDALPLAA